MSESVLVTGSSRGIGKAIALELSKSGYQVVIHYLARQEEAEEVIETIINYGGEARSLQFDVSNREQSKKTLEKDIAQHGAYYGVVCNAGISSDSAFPAMSGKQWDKVIHTNLDSFYNVLNPITMPMVRRRKPGRIVTLASISGIIGNRGQTNYSAAKAGIIAATKSLAIELAKRQITVNCVAPGIIETEMIDDLPIDQVLELIPARRAGSPEEVAALVNFLISPKSSYITRQVISVNGGMA